MGKIWRLAALVLLAPTGPALAAPAPDMLGFIDAATLSGFCTSTGEKAKEGRTICLSYVTGAVDQLLAEQSLGPPDARRICLPVGITAQAVLKTINAHAGWSSTAKGISAANFIRHAMEQAYPCQEQSDRRDM